MKSFRFGKHFEHFEYSLFFELVSFGELSKLETYKTVEYITDNFNLDKLNLLLEDYIESLSELKAQFYFDTFTEDDYHQAVADLISNGKELPYTDYPEDNKVIDKEKLLFPDEFSAGNKFIVTLNGFIRKQESQKPQSKSVTVVPTKPDNASHALPKLNLIDYKKKIDYTLNYYAIFLPLVTSLIEENFEHSLELIKLLAHSYKQVDSDKNLLTEQVHFELDPNDVKKYFKFAFIKIDAIIDKFDKRVKDPSIDFHRFIFNKRVYMFWLTKVKFSYWPIIYSRSQVNFVNLLFGNMKLELLNFRNALVESYAISLNPPLAELLRNKYSDIIPLPVSNQLGVSEMDHLSAPLTNSPAVNSSHVNSGKSKLPPNNESNQSDTNQNLFVPQIGQQPDLLSPSTVRHKRSNVSPRDFTSFFNHHNPEAAARLILKEFSKDTPITLTVLVHTLRYELAKPLLIINNGDFSAFHQAMAVYFNGIDIGKRQLYIKKSDVIQEQYKEVILGCKSRLIAILKSLDK